MGKRMRALLVLTVATLLTSASPARAQGEHESNGCDDLSILNSMPGKDVPLMARGQADTPRGPSLSAVYDDLPADAVSKGKVWGTVVTVPVWFHMVHSNGVGNVSDADIARQIQVLNEGFSGFRGGPDTGFNGHAYLDGIVVDWESMYKVSETCFDLGFTAVHEAGHWLGLHHTFNGACNAKGDYVDDTPSQGIPTSGWPADGTQDTCTREPGFDPIHNYMDYSWTSVTRSSPGADGPGARLLAGFPGLAVFLVDASAKQAAANAAVAQIC